MMVFGAWWYLGHDGTGLRKISLMMVLDSVFFSFGAWWYLGHDGILGMMVLDLVIFHLGHDGIWGMMVFGAWLYLGHDGIWGMMVLVHILLIIHIKYHYISAHSLNNTLEATSSHATKHQLWVHLRTKLQRQFTKITLPRTHWNIIYHKITPIH